MQTPQPTSFPPIVSFNTPPTPRSTNDAVLTPHSFHGMANDKVPIQLPVQRFCNDMARDGMEFLRKAEITDATCYHRNSIMSQHDYLIMCVRLGHAPDSKPCRVWMKIERNPTASSGPSSFSSSDAQDSVTFSHRLETLRPSDKDSVTMDCTFTELQLVHVVNLLEIIWDVCPQYTLLSFNCWFHAAVTLEPLGIFGREWKKKPAKDVFRTIVMTLGQPATSNINERFVARWAPNGVAIPSRPRTPQQTHIVPSQLSTIITAQPRSLAEFPLVQSPITITSPSHSELSTPPTPTSPEQNVRDGRPLSTIIWKDIIQGNNSKNKHILLALYPIIVTNEYLFTTLRYLFQDPPSPDVNVRLRVLEIIRLWVLGEHFSSDMAPAVSRFIDTYIHANDGRQDVESIRSALRDADVPEVSLKAFILEWNPSNVNPDAHSDTPSPSSKSGSFIKRLSLSSSDGIPANIRVRDINKKHIIGLARAFAQTEIQSRSEITVSKIVKGLLWEEDLWGDTHNFSQLSLYIHEWVFYSVLTKGIEVRADTYSKLVGVAEECLKIKNYATATDLVAALDDKCITDLKVTMKRISRDTQKRLAKVREGLNLVNDSNSALAPSVIHSWRSIIKHLHKRPSQAELKHVVNDANHSILWTNCQTFHSALEMAATTLRVSSQSLDFVHPSFHTFLIQDLQEGWETRRKRDHLAKKLAEGEKEEERKEERSRVGL